MIIIAVGSGPPMWLQLALELQGRGLVDYVYPEFFDDKDLLIKRKWGQYVRRLHEKRNTVKIAVWPDYCYEVWLKKAFSVAWVFPLHRKSELDFALRIDVDFIGMPQSKLLRDYSVQWFADVAREQGFRTWLLGLHRSLYRYLPLFNGTDITTLSLFSSYRDITKLTVEEVEKALRKIRELANARWEWLPTP